MTQADDFFAEYQQLSNEARMWQREEIRAIRRCRETGNFRDWQFREMDRACTALRGLADLALAKSELANAGVDISALRAPSLEGVA